MRSLIAFCTLLVCVASNAAYAGAWLQPEGKGLYISQATYFTNDEFYNRSGDKQPQSRFNKYEFQPYVEYGLLPNLTIGGTAYIQQVSQSDKINHGVADPELFVRTRLWHDDRNIVSLQPLIKLKSEFQDDAPPRGGSNSTDAELSLLYGRSLNILTPRDYLDVRLGYRHRMNNLKDQVYADAAVGIEVMPDLKLIPAIRSVTSTHIQKGAAFVENGNLDYNFVKAELGASYTLSETRALGLAVYDHIDGKQSGNGAGITLSFAQTF